MGSNLDRKFPPRPLTPVEANGLLSAAQSKRDKSLLILMWRCGLRCSEAVSLDLEHVRFEADATARIYVNKPKGLLSGVPPRTMGMDKRSASHLRTWVHSRGSHPGPFLSTRGGGRLSTSHCRRLVTRLGRSARIRHRVHPHGLRHTFAAELYAEGLGIRHIQVALGHSTLATTELYLTSIGSNETNDALIKREW